MLLGEEEPLDSQEQEQVILELHLSLSRMHHNWRRSWIVISLALAAVYGVMAVWQLQEPWGARHHAFFHGELTLEEVAVSPAPYVKTCGQLMCCMQAHRLLVQLRWQS